MRPKYLFSANGAIFILAWGSAPGAGSKNLLALKARIGAQRRTFHTGSEDTAHRARGYKGNAAGTAASTRNRGIAAQRPLPHLDRGSKAKATAPKSRGCRTIRTTDRLRAGPAHD